MSVDIITYLQNVIREDGIAAFNQAMRVIVQAEAEHLHGAKLFDRDQFIESILKIWAQPENAFSFESSTSLFLAFKRLTHIDQLIYQNQTRLMGVDQNARFHHMLLHWLRTGVNGQRYMSASSLLFKLQYYAQANTFKLPKQLSSTRTQIDKTIRNNARDNPKYYAYFINDFITDNLYNPMEQETWDAFMRLLNLDTHKAIFDLIDTEKLQQYTINPRPKYVIDIPVEEFGFMPQRKPGRLNKLLSIGADTKQQSEVTLNQRIACVEQISAQLKEEIAPIAGHELGKFLKSLIIAEDVESLDRIRPQLEEYPNVLIEVDKKEDTINHGQHDIFNYVAVIRKSVKMTEYFADRAEMRIGLANQLISESEKDPKADDIIHTLTKKGLYPLDHEKRLYLVDHLIKRNPEWGAEAIDAFPTRFAISDTMYDAITNNPEGSQPIIAALERKLKQGNLDLNFRLIALFLPGPTQVFTDSIVQYINVNGMRKFYDLQQCHWGIHSELDKFLKDRMIRTPWTEMANANHAMIEIFKEIFESEAYQSVAHFNTDTRKLGPLAAWTNGDTKYPIQWSPAYFRLLILSDKDADRFAGSMQSLDSRALQVALDNADSPYIKNIFALAPSAWTELYIRKTKYVFPTGAQFDYSKPFFDFHREFHAQVGRNFKNTTLFRQTIMQLLENEMGTNFLNHIAEHLDDFIHRMRHLHHQPEAYKNFIFDVIAELAKDGIKLPQSLLALRDTTQEVRSKKEKPKSIQTFLDVIQQKSEQTPKAMERESSFSESLSSSFSESEDSSYDLIDFDSEEAGGIELLSVVEENTAGVDNFIDQNQDSNAALKAFQAGIAALNVGSQNDVNADDTEDEQLDESKSPEPVEEAEMDIVTKAEQIRQECLEVRLANLPSVRLFFNQGKTRSEATEQIEKPTPQTEPM